MKNFKKHTQHFALLIVSIIVLTSCSEVKKETANELLLGTYSGKATLVLHYSQLNLGLEDDSKVEEVKVQIVRGINNEVVIKEDGRSMKINGVSLASNGSLFNIPQQKIIDDNIVMDLYGTSVAELEGIKYDGMLNLDNNKLEYGLELLTEFDFQGQKKDLKATAIYELTKLN